MLLTVILLLLLHISKGNDINCKDKYSSDRCVFYRGRNFCNRKDTRIFLKKNCAATCGYCSQNRDCKNALPERRCGELRGSGSCEDTPLLMSKDCPHTCGFCANTGWTEWGYWSACDVDCGDGVRYRHRKCLGGTCPGEDKHSESCTVTDCPKVPVRETFEHTGACNTQHGKHRDDPYYYSSQSKIPHIPSLSGFMGTHGTYRFFDVHEQIATFIGEGQHGMWRLQSAGYVRVYRTKGAEGIYENDKDAALDGNDQGLNKVLEDHYNPLDANNRYHDHSFGTEVSEDGWMNWLDLHIYHPKFGGKYEDHPVIDLPWYYCGLSGPDYPHLGNVWKYIKAQKAANKVGPLGKRAGMDIKENFNNILRMESIGDGSIYANIGHGDPLTDKMARTLDELNKRVQTIRYAKVDATKVASEIYILERGYHNYPEAYMIVGLVMDSLVDSTEYAYIRPDGRYYENVLQRNLPILNTSPNFDPLIYIENEASPQQIYGTPSFGVNHPSRPTHGLTGGICPMKGGDVSTYPWKNAGSGFPTDYEEITPICDGIMVEIKYWAYLDKEWDETTWLPNSGVGTKEIKYSAHANNYGEFKDEYLVKNGIINPHEVIYTEDGNIVDEAPNNLDDHPMVNFTFSFDIVGEPMEFVEVELDPLPRGCAAEEP